MCCEATVRRRMTSTCVSLPDARAPGSNVQRPAQHSSRQPLPKENPCFALTEPLPSSPTPNAHACSLQVRRPRAFPQWWCFCPGLCRDVPPPSTVPRRLFVLSLSSLSVHLQRHLPGRVSPSPGHFYALHSPCDGPDLSPCNCLSPASRPNAREVGPRLVPRQMPGMWSIQTRGTFNNVLNVY